MLMLLLFASTDPRIAQAAKLSLGDEVVVLSASADPKWLADARDVTVEPMTQQRCGRVPAVLSWRKGNRESRRQIILTLERSRTLVKLGRDVQVGQVLDESDLVVERTRRCDARDELTLSQTSDVVGMRTRTRIVKGAPLRATELEPVPVVKARDRLRLVVANGHMMVSAPAEALQSGAVGDRIRVTNLVSARVTTARIIDAQTAEVIP